MRTEPNIGAVYLGNGRCRFRVWAPLKKKVEVHLLSPRDTILGMEREDKGYWSVEAGDVYPGARYLFRLDDARERPDPASFSQPEGVHAPSEVLDPGFDWHDGDWSGPGLRDYILYELHVGTFTPEGTFDAVIPRLRELAELGITSIEIMPVAQFPGERNWGYDGVGLFAVQNSYGGPAGLKRLVDACHGQGLSVTLDVVYNHLGPEGNYLRDFGPYFTRRYITPWGDALNYDDRYNGGVRNFYIQNALYWFNYFHVDALRLDAVHAIYDRSAIPFLSRLADEVGALDRSGFLIAESDLNDSRLIRAKDVWGYGLDSQWSDDFHHSLHSLLTGEREGYYLDFGGVGHLAKAIKEGYVYSGAYSEFRTMCHGNRSSDLPSEKFVVAAQNHDQVGNRMLGERLSSLISFEAQKLMAAVLLLSPFIPLIFMGQEYGEKAPFLYFVSLTDCELAEAVRKGRREEFKEFIWKEEPPDPNSTETFLKSKLDWDARNRGNHKLLLNFYRELIRMRREHFLKTDPLRRDLEVIEWKAGRGLSMRRESGGKTLVCLFSFDHDDQVLSPAECGLDAGFARVLDSAEQVWGGPGSFLPKSAEPGASLKMKGDSVAVFLK